GKLALAAVEGALAAADAAEIEAQRREALTHESVKEGVDHLVVHGAAMLRVGMQQQRDRRVRVLAVMIAALDPPGRPVDDDLRHAGTAAATKPSERVGLPSLAPLSFDP